MNQHDITMAQRLGFQPDGLIRARPSPQQKWKLPVKNWVRELHQERFGHVVGPEPLSLDLPASGEKINDPELDDEAVRLYEEQMYWEDYRERNPPSERRTEQSKAKPQPEHRKDLPIADWFPADGQVGEDDGPF